MSWQETTRRRFLRTTAGIVAGVSLFSGNDSVVATQSSGEWRQFGYDDANTRHASVNTGPVSGIGARWTYETGNRVISSPAVADGTVYVGSYDTSVYALNADDGTEQWTYETGDWVDSSPSVTGGTVYVGSRDTSVYALYAGDGTVQWTYETGGHVGSSPGVADGTVYVGSRDNGMYALDASDGTVQWSYDTGDEVISSPAVADGNVNPYSAESVARSLPDSLTGASERLVPAPRGTGRHAFDQFGREQPADGPGDDRRRGVPLGKQDVEAVGREDLRYVLGEPW